MSLEQLQNLAGGVAIMELMVEHATVTALPGDGRVAGFEKHAAELRRRFNDFAHEIGATPAQVKHALELAENFKPFARAHRAATLNNNN